MTINLIFIHDLQFGSSSDRGSGIEPSQNTLRSHLTGND